MQLQKILLQLIQLNCYMYYYKLKMHNTYYEQSLYEQIYTMFPLDLKQSIKMVSGENIQYTNRRQKEILLRQMKAEHLKKITETTGFAHEAFRRVSEQNPQYTFGLNNFNNSISNLENQQSMQHGKSIQKTQLKKRKIKIMEQSKYDFRKINEYVYFKDDNSVFGQQKKKLSIRQIQLLEELQFSPEFESYDFHDQYMELKSNKNNPSKERLLEFDRDLHLTLSKTELKIAKIGDNCLLGKFSKYIVVPFQAHLTLNYKISNKPYKPLQMPKNIEKISIMQLFPLCADRYSVNHVKRYFQEIQKIKHNEKIKFEENQIQKKYKDLKEKIQNIKELKKQKKVKVLVHTGMQMEKVIQDESMNQLIQVNTQKTIRTIKDLEKIRQKAQEEDISKSQKQVFVHEINKEMRSVLFNLLITVIKDQKFINYAEYIKSDNRFEVQDRILEKIYLHLNQIKGKQTRSHQKKMELLNLYLNQRKYIKDHYENPQPSENKSLILKKKR